MTPSSLLHDCTHAYPSLPFFPTRPTSDRDLSPFPTRRSSDLGRRLRRVRAKAASRLDENKRRPRRDRRRWKSTRLNSSHVSISYAVFCLKKKKKKIYLLKKKICM